MPLGLCVLLWIGNATSYHVSALIGKHRVNLSNRWRINPTPGMQGVTNAYTCYTLQVVTSI